MNALKKIKKLIKNVLGMTRKTEKYVYDPAHTIIKDYSDFSGLSIQEIEHRINSFRSLTQKEWESLPVNGFKAKAEQFYASSSYYICDLLTANSSKAAVTEKLDGFSPLILNTIRNHPGHRFVEFGGGTGVFCEIVADMGKDVTYLDIPSQQMNFAKWRFEKYSIPIHMQISKPGKLELEGMFDIIYTDAVIEHLPDPITPIAELSRHLDKGGALIMLVDLAGEEEDMPMHKDVDIVKLHATLANEGLVNTYGLNQFASIWSRP